MKRCWRATGGRLSRVEGRVRQRRDKHGHASDCKLKILVMVVTCNVKASR